MFNLDTSLRCLLLIYSHGGNALADFAGYQEILEVVNSVDVGMDNTSLVFPYAKSYNNGVIMNVVVTELTRNILLAMACVFICSLFLIANLTTTLIVCVNVSVTLMCVAGNHKIPI